MILTDNTNIINDYKTGMGLHPLARKYGNHYTTIKRIVIGAGIEPRKVADCKTIKHANAIITLYKSGTDSVKLGKRFSIAPVNIRKFLRMNGVKRRTREEYCKKYPINIDQFRDPSDELASYWLGFLYADGHMRRYNTGTYMMKVKLAARDIGHLYQLARDLYTTKIPTRQKSISPKGKPVESATFIVTNKEFYMLMQSYGWFEFKKGKIKLPDNLDLRHFVRGLIDGDGIISTSDHKKYLRFGFCSPHRNIVKFVKKLCDNWISANPATRKITTRKNKNANIYSAHWVGATAIQLGRFLYCNSTRYLKRKTDLIMSFVNQPSSRPQMLSSLPSQTPLYSPPGH